MGNQRQATAAPGIEVREASIRLRFTDQNGKRHSPRMTAGGRAIKPSAGSIRAAERLLSDVKASIHLGEFTLSKFFPDLVVPDEVEKIKTKPIPTLGEQLDVWLSGLMVAKSTRAGYEAAVRFWKIAPSDTEGKLLASIPINEIVFSQIRHGLAAGASRHRRGKIDADHPAKPLKAKTVNNYLGALRAALELAIDDDIIASNPAGEGSKLRQKVQRGQPDPLSLDELELVLGCIRAKSEAAGDYVEFWGLTGLRTSELNGLHWDDVDLRAGTIRVHQARVRGEMKSTTKTSRERDVLLEVRARACLERQRARTQLAGGLVWVNPLDGLPWDGDRDFVRSHWRPALRALGIRYRRPYNLRHTRATMLLMAGVRPALAAKWLGHDLKMFFEVYARWIDSDSDAGDLAKIEAMTSPSHAGQAKGVAHGG